MKTVSVRDARANFSELLGTVYYTNIPIMVEKKGKPIAVVVSPQQYKIIKQEEKRDWAIIDELQARNADQDPDKVHEEVTRVTEEVRKEMYEKEKSSSGSH